MVRHPRFELGPSAWKADILAIILMPHIFRKLFYTNFVGSNLNSLLFSCDFN